jgi:hypothetical protein
MNAWFETPYTSMDHFQFRRASNKLRMAAFVSILWFLDIFSVDKRAALAAPDEGRRNAAPRCRYSKPWHMEKAHQQKTLRGYLHALWLSTEKLV